MIIRKIKTALAIFILLAAISNIQANGGSSSTVNVIKKLVAIVTGEVDYGYGNSYGYNMGGNKGGYYPQPYGGYQQGPSYGSNYGSNKWSINGTVTIEKDGNDIELTVDVNMKSYTNSYPSYGQNEIERSLRIHELGITRQYNPLSYGSNGMSSGYGGNSYSSYGSYGGNRYGSYGGYGYGTSIKEVCDSAGDEVDKIKTLTPLKERYYRIYQTLEVETRNGGGGGRRRKRGGGGDGLELSDLAGLSVVLYESKDGRGARIACGTLVVADIQTIRIV